MPQVTDQSRLLRDYDLQFLGKGPRAGMWRCQYLKCPECGYYVCKGGGYDECLCGNISIDSDYLRVIVARSDEFEIETFNAQPRGRKRSR